MRATNATSATKTRRPSTTLSPPAPSSRHIWWSTLTVLGADAAQVGGGGLHRRLVGAVEKRWHRGKRKGADTLFALVAWELWKERNTRLFWNEVATSVQLATIKQIADLWIEAGARHLGELVRE